jgi:hypothetical protein
MIEACEGDLQIRPLGWQDALSALREPFITKIASSSFCAA